MHKLIVSLVLLALGAAAQADPEVGDPAPAFRLQDQNGEWHTLDDYRGQWVAL